jgi:hypothetical protein
MARKAQQEKKVTFTKMVVALVMVTYFIGFYVGVKIAVIDTTQLGVLLAYIGTPTGITIGFYCWKSKAENIVKIAKSNPDVPMAPVDLNTITSQ